MPNLFSKPTAISTSVSGLVMISFIIQSSILSTRLTSSPIVSSIFLRHPLDKFAMRSGVMPSKILCKLDSSSCSFICYRVVMTSSPSLPSSNSSRRYRIGLLMRTIRASKSFLMRVWAHSCFKIAQTLSMGLNSLL